MIEINDVTKFLGNKKVLNDITVNIEKGEIFGLLGPSGAGKTTLIRLLIGAIEAEDGEIIIDGIKVPDKEVIKRIGFMPQNDALYNDLSGYDNLVFFGSLFNLKRKELERKVNDVLKLVGLTEDSHKLVDKYSGGMKKRLSLAIALLHDPDILILDEPTVGIDPLLRRRIWQEFNKLKNEGKTIIVTTHVMDEASMCDKAGLIYEGKLIACGTIIELCRLTEKGTLEELFFLVKKGVENETFVF